MSITGSNNLFTISLLVIPGLFLGACSQESPPTTSEPATSTRETAAETPAVSAETDTERRPNILVIIGDDMGSETLSCTGIGDNPATTPNLDQLCDEGVTFSNFWSQPVCTPTRTAMMTGRYAIRTGVGRPTGDGPPEVMGEWPDIPEKPAGAPFEASRGGGGMGMGAAMGGMGGGMGPGGVPSYGPLTSEYMLPMAFRDNPELGYSTAAIGKWHLADTRNGWLDHPNLAGFDHFSGLIRGFLDSYFAWNQTVNGEVTGTTGYTPDRKVEDAIAWLEKQGDDPWFMWFAFNLPHSPLHLTPEELWQKDRSNLDPQANPNENQQEYFFAMMEAMDGEIGRLLNSMDAETRANTYIMFIGDNGSTRGTLQEPYLATGGKATVYQGGVNVPMIVAGPGVPAGTTADALVNSTDFFVSIMELAEIDPETTVPEGITTDSISFVPYLTDPGKESIRNLIYADTFGGNFDGIEDADFAMRDLEYKILRRGGEFEFYYLVDDPFENNNLLLGELNGVQQGRYDKLLADVTDLRETRSYAEPEITLSLK